MPTTRGSRPVVVLKTNGLVYFKDCAEHAVPARLGAVRDEGYGCRSLGTDSVVYPSGGAASGPMCVSYEHENEEHHHSLQGPSNIFELGKLSERVRRLCGTVDTGVPALKCLNVSKLPCRIISDKLERISASRGIQVYF